MDATLDGVDQDPVADTYHFTNLATGSRTLAVTVTDPAGNVSTATFNWSVTTPPPPADTTAPAITFWHTKPAEGSTSEVASATFAWDTDDADASWYGSLDGGDPVLLGGTQDSRDGLTEGVHTWTVYGVDAAGNQSDPFTVHWTVDVPAPPVVQCPAPTIVWFETPKASTRKPGTTSRSSRRRARRSRTSWTSPQAPRKLTRFLSALR